MNSVHNHLTFNARTACLALAISACVVSSARADSVGVLVNGACEFGTCPPTPLASDMSLSEPFSFTTTLPNGDMFELSGLLTASNSGGNSISFGADPGSGLLVQYLGNGHGGPSEADTLTVNTTFAFSVNFSSGTFFEGPIEGGFSSNISPGSSAAIIGLNNGDTIATFGPFAAPGPFHADAVSYSASNTGTVALGETAVSFFAAGAPVGSSIFYGATPAIPEPSAVVLMCIGLVMLGFAVQRGARQEFARVSRQ